MIKLIKGRSFQKKILCSYFLLLLLTLVIFIICYIQGVSSALSHQVDYMRQANEQRNINLDIAMGNHSSLNFLHFIDSKINVILHERRSEMTPERRYESDSYLSGLLRMLAVINPHVRRISVLTEHGDFYSSVSYNADEYVERMLKQREAITWESKGQRYYTAPYPLTIGNSGYSTVTVIHQMADIGREDCFAYLLLDLDFGAITEAFHSSLVLGELNTSFAIFSDTEIIHSSRNGDINFEQDMDAAKRAEVLNALADIGNTAAGDGTVVIGGVSYIVSVRLNEATGWYLVHLIPRSRLLGSSMGSMIQVMAGVLVLLAAAGILSLLFSRQISEPIRRLSKIMGQARYGQVRLYEGSHDRADEIGQLIDSYNAMVRRIKDSITRLYIAQLNQKQAELKMLQFQINPHFLYNALGTVTAIARLSDITEIPLITESLSDMFRYNSKGDDFVTLKEEIEQLKSYLRIQSVRFPERFIIEYDVPEDVADCGVIKFILQPIVENSIRHAFSVRRPKDFLKVAARKEDGDLLISIYDDGCGMPEEKMAELNQLLKGAGPDTIISEDGQGIGLVNVNARVKNFYGSDYGVSIESALGAFTCIHIRLKLSGGCF